MMARPPLSAGATQLTVAVVLPGVADTTVGAPGVVGCGVTELDAVELPPVATVLKAATLKV